MMQQRRTNFKRWTGRTLSLVMAASLALQGAPMTALANDVDPESQGGGGVGLTLDEELPVEVTEELPAESPAEENGEDVPAQPETITDTTEEEPMTEEDEIEEIVVEGETESESLPALNSIGQYQTIPLTIGDHGKLIESPAGNFNGTGSNISYVVTTQNATLESIETDIAANVEGVNWAWKFGGLKIKKSGESEFVETKDQDINAGDELQAIFVKKDFEVTLTADHTVLAAANKKDENHPNAKPGTATLSVALENGVDTLPAASAMTGLAFEAANTETTADDQAVGVGAADGTATAPTYPLTAKKAGEDTIKVTATVGTGSDAVTYEKTIDIAVVAYGYIAFNLDANGGAWKDTAEASDKVVYLDTDDEGKAYGEDLLAALKGKDANLNPKAGMEFATWLVDGADIADEDEYADESPVTVKASYKPITYTVQYYFYDSDGDALTGVDNDANESNRNSYTIDDLETSAIMLAEPEAGDGYEFVGWYKKATITNGKASFADEDALGGAGKNEIAQDTTGRLDLYGVFSVEEYDVNYKFYVGDAITDTKALADADVVNPNKDKKYSVKSDSITVKNPTANGYTFRGWYGKAEQDASDNTKFVLSQPIADAKIESGSTGNKDFFGYFTKNAEVEAIAFEDSVIVIQAGTTEDAKVTVQSEGAVGVNYDVQYTSVSPSYATIEASDGLTVTIKGVKKGETTVRATAGGKTATIRVIVQDEKVVAPDTIEIKEVINGKTEDIRTDIEDQGANQVMTLKADVTGEGEKASLADVTWAIEDEKVDGVAVAPGAVATIDATTGVVSVKKQTKNASFKVVATSVAKSGIHGDATINVSKYYTVTFTDPLKSESAPEQIKVKYGEKLSTGTYTSGDNAGKAIGDFLAPAAVDGYENASWKDADSNPIDKDTVMADKNLAVIAKRDKISYTIEYVYEDASSYPSYKSEATGAADYDKIGNDNPKTYTVETNNGDPIELAPAELEDYTFVGWYSDAARSDDKKVAQIDPTKGYVTGEGANPSKLYAKFTRNIALGLEETYTDGGSAQTRTAYASYVVTLSGDKDHPATFDRVKAKVTPAGTEHTVKYEISPEQGEDPIATVDEDTGEVTLLKKGEVKVVAKAGTLNASYILQIEDAGTTVNPPAALRITERNSYNGKSYDYYAAGNRNNTVPASIQLSAVVYALTDQGLEDATDQNVIWTAKALTAGGAAVENTVGVDNTGKITFRLENIKENTNITVTATARADSTKTSSVTFTINKYYPLTFYPNNGVRATEKWFKAGSLVADDAKPANPTAKGKTFQGWVAADEEGTATGSTPVTFPYLMPADEAANLAAKWDATRVAVTYDYGTIKTSVSGTATYDETITIPAAAQHTDKEIITEGGKKYRFEGWFEDSAYKKAFDPSKKSTHEENFTVYAKMRPVYEITFSAGSGKTFTDAPTTIVVAENENITLPTGLYANEGALLLGWKKGDAEYKQTKATFTDAEMTAGGFELTANWEDHSTDAITVTFDADGKATNPTDENPTYGAKILAPTVTATDAAHYPSVEGWYNGDVKWDFANDVVTKSITLKAKWNVKSYAYTFKTDDGTTDIATADVVYNEKIAATKIPMSYDGKKIKEWTKAANGGGGAATPGDQVADDDYTFYAVFEELPTEEEAYELFNDTFDPIIVITNAYSKTATVAGDVKLADYVKSGKTASGWSWYANAASAKTVASYAGKGVIALQAKYEAGDGEVYITAPVRFVTITKLEMIYDGTKVVADESAVELIDTGIVTLVPTTTGGSIYDEEAIRKAVVTDYLADSSKFVINGASANESLIKWETDDFVVQESPTLAKATSVTLSMTGKPVGGNDKELKASVKVTVVPEATVFSDIAAEALDPDTAYADDISDKVIAAAFQKDAASAKNFTLTGHIEKGAAKTVTVASDSAKVVKAGKVTMTANGDGYDFSIAMSAAGGYGTAILTLTANDVAKTTATVVVTIYPSEPQVSITTATLDMVSLAGAPFSVTPAYEQEITQLEVLGVEVPSKASIGTDAAKQAFEIEPVGVNAYVLKLTGDDIADIEGIIAGKYKVKIGEGDTQYGKDITVTVANKQPAVAVKQGAAINLNYQPGQGLGLQTLNISTKAGNIQNVSFTGESAGALFPYAAGSVTTSGSTATMEVMENENAPSVDKTSTKKVKLALEVEGYRKNAIQKDFTLSVTDKMPAFKLSASSVTMYPDFEIEEATLTATVGGQSVATASSVGYKVEGALASLYEADAVAGNAAKITVQGGKKAAKASGTLVYTDKDLKDGKSLSAKLTVNIGNTSAVKVKLDKTSVTMNRTADATGLSNDNLIVPVSVTGVPGGFSGIKINVTPKTAGTKLEVAQNGSASELKVAWDDTTGRAAKGSYKFDVDVALTVNGKDFSLSKPSTLTVKVVDTALAKSVSFTQKGTIDLMDSSSAITVTPKVTGLNGKVAQVTDVTLGGKDASLFEVSAIDANGVFTIKPAKAASRYVTGYKYDVTIAAVKVTHADDAETAIDGIDKKLTVSLKQSQPKVTLTPASYPVIGIQNAKDNEISITVNTTLTGAGVTPTIKSVTQVYDKKIGDAFTVDATGVTGQANGTLKLTQTKMLKKGTYTVKFLVIYNNQAANAKDIYVAYKIVVK